MWACMRSKSICKYLAESRTPQKGKAGTEYVLTVNASAGTNVATSPDVGICVSCSSHWCAPLPAGPGAPKIWLCVTTVHLFDQVAGILCNCADGRTRAHLLSPINQGCMFLSIICKENAINYSWLRNHQICILAGTSLSFLQNFKSLLSISCINSKDMSCRLKPSFSLRNTFRNLFCQF